ncbi:MAG TPA: queuosine precursor transporter, partial [Saprospiraceae bacterium]|nr:queuosine precursor transporter [Saprospiraceae bacterium]
IIIGSLSAFLLGQLIDVFVFQQLRKVTGPKLLWLRATGSTLVSQLIDSFVVLFIAFYGTFSTPQIIAIGITNYLYKFVVAIVLTPAIYGGHFVIDRYLGRENAEKIAEDAAHESGSFL